MPYKMGCCTQTGKQILIRDTNGKWNSAKKDCYMADLVFSSGGKVPLLLCEEATKNPDIAKIYEELIHPASDSFTYANGVRDYVMNVYGEPKALVNIRKHPMNKGL